jgi:hypothetical protein
MPVDPFFFCDCIRTQYSTASELYRPSDRRLSANLMPTFLWIPRPYCQISRPEPLIFLPRSSSVVLTRLSAPRSRPTTFFLIVPGNRTQDLRICSKEVWPLDHTALSKEMKNKQKSSMASVRERSIPTERPTLCQRSQCQSLRIEGVAWSVWRIPRAVFSAF